MTCFVQKAQRLMNVQLALLAYFVYNFFVVFVHFLFSFLAYILYLWSSAVSGGLLTKTAQVSKIGLHHSPRQASRG